MNLKVHISKKGTRVVLATDLYQALGLPEQHFGTTVRQWINDVYAFPDGLRGPLRLQDYAQRKFTEQQVVKDYYLSVTLAKMIALRTKSKSKRKVALHLQAYEESSRAQWLSRAQLEGLVEITKAMSLVSCQEAARQRHLHMYCKRNEGSAARWWAYRNSILGYAPDELKRRLRRQGLQEIAGTQFELWLQIDPQELIRAGVIDHFMAQGKDEQYARQMGDLAKYLARELELDVFDDQNGGNIFAPDVQPGLLQALRQVDQRA